MVIDTILRNTTLADKLISYYAKTDKISEVMAIQKLEDLTPLAKITMGAKPKQIESSEGDDAQRIMIMMTVVQLRCLTVKAMTNRCQIQVKTKAYCLVWRTGAHHKDMGPPGHKQYNNGRVGRVCFCRL